MRPGSSISGSSIRDLSIAGSPRPDSFMCRCLALGLAITAAGCSGTQGSADGGADGGPADLVTTPDLQPAPAPIVTTVTPAFGPTTSETSLVIMGMNFVSGASVTVGGQAATAVVVGSSTKLLAVAQPRPGKPGAADVVVTNPDGKTGALAGGFTYQLSSLSFALPYGVPTGGIGSAVAAIVDLDGDQKPDVVVVNAFAPSLSVLMGMGGGKFAAPLVIPGKQSVAIAVGDANGDGAPDVVTADYAADEDGVYLNSGGMLGARTGVAFPAMSKPSSVALGDLDGDGKLDLVTALRAGPAVATSLGLGGGTFAPPVMKPITGMYPAAIAIGRFDPDTHLDAVTGFATGMNASLLHGSGDGKFSSESMLAIDPAPTGFAIGDLNADGKSDLAAVALGGSAVKLLLGSPGGLSAQPAIPVGTGPAWIVIADLNLDGKLDLVTANAGSSEVAVLVGRGDGTFVVAAKPPGPSNLRWVGVADVDGDGLPDVLAVSTDSKDLQVFRNQIK